MDKSSESHSCCGTGTVSKKKIDFLLWGAMFIVSFGYVFSFLSLEMAVLTEFSESVYELINTMWWGIVIGMIFIGLLNHIPRDFVMAVLGTGNGIKGIWRATLAGVLLDLCSHGILMVGAKLYDRGASLGQIMAFLIASPWNSFSLTLILWALIGFKWMISFLVISMVIGIISGLIFDRLEKKGVLPSNPNTSELPKDFHFWTEVRSGFEDWKLKPSFVLEVLKDGVIGSRIVVRWTFVGVILASLIRVFMEPGMFQDYFGASLFGLMMTIVAATIIEVCSEGTTPIAADILNRAHAPGNSFAFLMTGVSTDYTEIMVLKDTTRSWKIALFLPLITVPQVIVVALVLNGMGG